MTQLPAAPPLKARPRVDFSMVEFKKLMYTKGVDLTWEQCAECPCSLRADAFPLGALVESTNVVTGEARQDCTLCKGRGYFWHSPQTIRALVTNASSNTDKYALYGQYAKGMVSISLLPEHLPGYGDRYTVQDSVQVYREAQVRVAGALQELRYPVTPRLLDLATGQLALGVLRIQRASVSGLSTEADALEEGVDFTVTEAGLVDFTLGDALGTAPVVGARYTASYYSQPRYYAVDTPHTHRDSTLLRKSTTERPLLLPVQVHCSLEFMGFAHG